MRFLRFKHMKYTVGIEPYIINRKKINSLHDALYQIEEAILKEFIFLHIESIQFILYDKAVDIRCHIKGIVQNKNKDYLHVSALLYIKQSIELANQIKLYTKVFTHPDAIYGDATIHIYLNKKP
jgi:hypothetical protein